LEEDQNSIRYYRASTGRGKTRTQKGRQMICRCCGASFVPRDYRQHVCDYCESISPRINSPVRVNPAARLDCLTTAPKVVLAAGFNFGSGQNRLEQGRRRSSAIGADGSQSVARPELAGLKYLLGLNATRCHSFTQSASDTDATKNDGACNHTEGGTYEDLNKSSGCLGNGQRKDFHPVEDAQDATDRRFTKSAGCLSFGQQSWRSPRVGVGGSIPPIAGHFNLGADTRIDARTADKRNATNTVRTEAGTRTHFHFSNK
jgi:hypothetical protein